jgi:TolB protein
MLVSFGTQTKRVAYQHECFTPADSLATLLERNCIFLMVSRVFGVILEKGHIMKKPVRVICLLLVAVVCASILVNCSKKSTRSCGGGELIAFLSDRSGHQYKLWTMKWDGTEQRMLEGAWSAPAQGRAPLVSPDGKKIVFAQSNKSQGWAMIVNADGSGLDTLAVETPLSFVYPVDWSPDGSKLVYFVVESYMEGFQGAVFVVNPDGSGKLRLDEGYNPRFCGNDRVVYSRWDGIYVIGTNGEDKTRLQETLYGAGLHVPAGSPDGEKVAFCRALVVPPPNQKCWLEIIDSGEVKLAEMSGLFPFAEIEFSPEGKRMLFLAAGETSAEIYVVNIDGSDLRRLTNDDILADGHARWSPDGSRIVFTSMKDGNPEIYTVNSSGPPVIRRLTNNAADDCSPDW